MQDLLEVRNLTVQSVETGAVLVDNAGFSIREKEVLGFVGFSGAGKTLTMLSLFRLLPDTVQMVRGEVFISVGGRRIDVMSLPEEKIAALRGRFVSYLFQDPRKSLNPVITVGLQIEEMLRYHTDLSKVHAEEKTHEILKKVGFPDPERIYHCYPHQLSGGECQRVIIAGGVLLKPSVIIADEPTASLDVTTEVKIVKLLRELSAELPAALVFITHNVYLLRKITDRMIFIREGRIQGAMPNDEEAFACCRDPYITELVQNTPEFGKRIGGVA